jgi:hypothetical protein
MVGSASDFVMFICVLRTPRTQNLTSINMQLYTRQYDHAKLGNHLPHAEFVRTIDASNKRTNHVLNQLRLLVVCVVVVAIGGFVLLAAMPNGR